MPALPPPTLSDAEHQRRQIIYRLLEVSHLMLETRAIYADLAEVTPPQFSILTALQEAPGLAVGEVAARLNVSGPFVTMEVRKLRALGLVARQPGLGDKRRSELFLTPLGEARLNRAVEERLATNSLIFDRFSSEELLQLDQSLSGLLTGLQTGLHHLKRPGPG